MAATSVEVPANSVRAAPAPLELVVADATWYSTAYLFSALERPGLSTLLLRCLDYRNAMRQGWMPWRGLSRLERTRATLWHRDLVLPSGWMKTFPRWGMRPIGRAVADWRAQQAPVGRLVLVMTYPHYLYLRDLLQPDLTVYYNIDDYSQYWPHRAERVNALEQAAVAESDLTVCVSRLRAEQLRDSMSGSAERVRHLSHGAPLSSLAAAPCVRPGPPPADLAGIPGPRLGYVGTLEDRVDWELLDRLATGRPEASLVLIGQPQGQRSGRAEPWQVARHRCLGRPNVHLLGWRPQEVLARYVQAFDVCLIPYRIDHPFNQMCSPTKIMDYMGSGRPIVATALPECRLHTERFHVSESTDAFVDAVRSILASGSDDGRARLRHDYALENRCDRVAERLLTGLGL
jgi:glycosyltransferase involved in cell wall biosynthesis